MKLKVFLLAGLTELCKAHSQDASGMIKSVDIGFLFIEKTNIVLENLHFGWIPLY